VPEEAGVAAEVEAAAEGTERAGAVVAEGAEKFEAAGLGDRAAVAVEAAAAERAADEAAQRAVDVYAGAGLVAG
jgi:hypothetical protein